MYLQIHLFSTDKTAPEVLFCPDDIVKVLFSDDLPTGISWSDPVFTDNTGVVDIKQTHQSGKVCKLQ